MSRERRKRERPVWVIGDSAGGTVVALVFFVVGLLMALLAVLIASKWASVPVLVGSWALVPLAALAIGVAIASIVYHRCHIPGYDGEHFDQGADA